MLTATATAQLIANTFSGVGDTIVTYLMPVGLLLFAGILIYFWGKRFVKKHLHS